MGSGWVERENLVGGVERELVVREWVERELVFVKNGQWSGRTRINWPVLAGHGRPRSAMAGHGLSHRSDTPRAGLKRHRGGKQHR